MAAQVASAPPVPARPVRLALPPVEELRALVQAGTAPLPERVRAALAVVLADDGDEMSRGALIAGAMRLCPDAGREVYVESLAQLVREGAVREAVGLYLLA